jgi:CRP/FNR family transcriptional regulator, cyclic AMP receptor protein
MVSLDDIALLRKEWPQGSFLAQLSMGDLEGFLGSGRLRSFPRDATLIEEGGLDSHVYLLLSSCVKITARLPAQAEALLAVRVGGNVVGNWPQRTVSREAQRCAFAAMNRLLPPN